MLSHLTNKSFAMKGLERAVKLLGRIGVAKATGVDTAEAVSNWKSRGVPPGRCLAIQIATKGEVTVHDLRPDIFGAKCNP